jgi:hypothetical protein
VTVASPPAIQVSGLAAQLSVPSGAGEGAASWRPVVRRFRVRLSAAALQRLVAPAGVQLRLAPGGGVLGARVGRVPITAELAGTVTERGTLRVEATSLRLGGLLPLPPGLAALGLSAAGALPGVRAVPPRAIELDLAALLEHLLRPWNVTVAARIRRVWITAEFIEAECFAGEDDAADLA